jgi:hypothetical protein
MNCKVSAVDSRVSVIVAALVNYLQAEGIEESSEEFKRVKANWRKAGAIWTIWHPSDGACIRNFIREVVAFFICPR